MLRFRNNQTWINNICRISCVWPPHVPPASAFEPDPKKIRFVLSIYETRGSDFRASCAVKWILVICRSYSRVFLVMCSLGAVGWSLGQGLVRDVPPHLFFGLNLSHYSLVNLRRRQAFNLQTWQPKMSHSTPTIHQLPRSCEFLMHSWCTKHVSDFYFGAETPCSWIKVRISVILALRHRIHACGINLGRIDDRSSYVFFACDPCKKEFLYRFFASFLYWNTHWV